MTFSDYIVNFLVNKGVTDAFGIPGGVILDLLYSIDASCDISAHLSFHEQAAMFSASGYAQTSGKIGVAYATRGPGITNMITGIIDAHHDSIPVMIFTAHTTKIKYKEMRIEENQELCTEKMFKDITKYAVKIDDITKAVYEFEKAYYKAVSNRKGPVFLDINAKLFSSEIDENCAKYEIFENGETAKADSAVNCIKELLKKSKRPVLLYGDGINQAGAQEKMRQIAENNGIPVISSRFSLDVMGDSEYNYGYIGSHAIRYGNFMLSKADLIISIGNRLSFPLYSKSYEDIAKKSFIRIDIDEKEFLRDLPNSRNYKVDINIIADKLCNESLSYIDKSKWLETAQYVKDKLFSIDVNLPVNIMKNIATTVCKGCVVTSDVGNNEFWLSRAFAYGKLNNRVIYSKSFGALGCSLPKAIGAFYATKKPVICFAGDQGFQLNIQELQFIAMNKLPILIVVMNNSSSGMIKSRQKIKYKDKFVHATLNSGYGLPCIEKISNAYGLNYIKYCVDFLKCGFEIKEPTVLEVVFSEEIDLDPNLPFGNECQNLTPLLDAKLYNELNKL